MSKLESVKGVGTALEETLASLEYKAATESTLSSLSSKIIKADTDSVKIADIPKVAIHRYLPPTYLPAGGTATIWTPSSGKAIRVKRIQVSVDAATRIDLRWGTTTFESYFLPANGSIIVNLIGTNNQGEVNVPLTIFSSSAATVTASVDGDEV